MEIIRSDTFPAQSRAFITFDHRGPLSNSGAIFAVQDREVAEQSQFSENAGPCQSLHLPQAMKSFYPEYARNQSCISLTILVQMMLCLKATVLQTASVRDGLGSPKMPGNDHLSTQQG